SAVLVRHLHDDIPSLPDPEMNRSPLGTALQCALTKDPEERVASALQFIDILNGEFEVEVELEPPLEVVSEPAYAEPPRPPMPAEEPLTLPGQKTLALFAALAVCIVLLGVVLGFVLVSSGRPPTATSETVDIGGQSHQQETHNNSNPTSITYDFNTDEVNGPAQDGRDPSTSGGNQRSTSDTRGLAPSKDAQRPASAPRRTTDVQSPEAASAEKTAVEKTVVEHKAPDVAPKEASKTPAVARTVLRVTSDPPGAKVLVNGQPAGLTPCTRQVRQGGVVRVKISKVGYKTEMRTLSPKGRNHALSVRLKPGRIKLSP
ncbi:MAG: PEGA domain-containing protein, partial [Myxococcota bacterium]